VTTFTGTSTASGATTTAGAAATATTAGATTAAGTAPPGAIGSLTLGVSGAFPSSAHFDPVAQWIDGLTASSMFSAPGVASVTNQPVGGNTTVAFQSSLWLTAASDLTKNVGS